MNEQEALGKMKYPRDFRGPRRIFQIWVTRACDKGCYGCTQGSNLGGKPGMITPEQYEEAVLSMRDYPGVIAMFGGNPCIHPQFDKLCEIARKYIPHRQRGIWTNNLMGKGAIARRTFNPLMSNFNVHGDKKAAEEFVRDWPETKGMIKGINHESSHSPVFVSMLDLNIPEEERWELISGCDINQRWSAMIGVFRGELRGWFCEIAGSQSMLHQNDPSFPDTGLKIERGWWKQAPEMFHDQVRFHCHRCSVPLRGKGALDQSGPAEQVSVYHLGMFKPKIKSHEVQVVNDRKELGRVPHSTDYLANFQHHKEKDLNCYPGDLTEDPND